MRSGWALAIDCALQERAEEAERVARESFALERELEKGAQEGNRLLYLGIVLIWIGKYAEAQSALEQSMELLTDQASLFPLTEARARLARAKIHLGEYKGAYAHAQGAFALADLARAGLGSV